jgi:hypothetical protein
MCTTLGQRGHSALPPTVPTASCPNRFLSQPLPVPTASCPNRFLSQPLPVPTASCPNRFYDQRFWRGVRCAWLPCEVEEGCGQSTPQCAPHVQGLRNPPHNKIASAAVISTRSIRALSRLKSTAETKNSASKGIRLTLVIIAINSSLRSKDSSIPTVSHCCQPPPKF